MAQPRKKRTVYDLEDVDTPNKQFLSDLGLILGQWGVFELVLEAKICKLAKLVPKDGTIILGGLSFGKKPAILYSLLSARRRIDVIPKVKAVINHAKRNALVHSTIGYKVNLPITYSFYRREIGDRYVVQHHHFTPRQFSNHAERLIELIEEAMRALNVSERILREYINGAGLLRPTRRRPPTRRPRAKSRNK